MLPSASARAIMMENRRLVLWPAIAWAPLVVAGCSRAGATLTERYAPDKAAQVAMDTYDANKDGKIDAAELDKCLALKYALPRIDAPPGDKALTAEEIAARVEKVQGQSKLMGAMVHVTSRQGPVSGAKVTLQQEVFMGEDQPAYSLTTDERGNGMPAREGSDQPEMAIPLGFYRVTITAPGQAGEIIRGCEVADDSPSSNRLVFSLQEEAPQAATRPGGR
jgi:hypothetical protein